MQDISTALRSLRRRPAFTAVAVLTLALGIGANAAIFSVIDAVLLRGLPYPEPERLVVPYQYSEEVRRQTGYERLPSSPGDATDFIERNRTFERLAYVRADRVSLSGDGVPERIGAVRVSRDFFRVLGVQPILGRTFSESDVSGERLVLIGHDLWQRRYGSDPRVLERKILVNGEPATILGVLPPWFRFPVAGELPEAFGYSATCEIWTLDVLSPQQRTFRGGKSFSLVGRLRHGVTIEQAEADLNVIADDIARVSPSSNSGWTVRIVPLRELLVGQLRPALMVLLTAVAFVLLIACANVANLLLVRAADRQREVAVRFALGAARGRLIRLMLVESLVLSLAAAAMGLLVAWWGLRTLLAILPASLPAVADATLDWRVVTFTAVVSIITGAVFGAVPAIQATRGEVSHGLREGTRGTVGSRRVHRTRNVLVVVEVALAVVLLVGAVLLTQTFIRLVGTETGFRTDGLLTMEVALPYSTYGGQRAADFFERVLARLASAPGVDGVAVTSGLPLSGQEQLRQITIENRPRPEPGHEIIADYRVVTPDYFRIMGIPQVSGELFPETLPAGSPNLVLINSVMARSYWPDQNPIGHRIRLTGPDQASPWFTIVGVVGDVRQSALDQSVRPQVYVHHQVDPSVQMVVVLRSAGDPLALAPVARAAVYQADPHQPAGRIRTMRAVVFESVSNRRFTMSLAGAFAFLALGLSLVGLYAVVSQSVAERTREMGVRLALGAAPAGLLRMVLVDGLRLVVAGIAVGLAGAFVLTRFLETLLFGVSVHDVTTFVAVPLLLVATAVLGCLVPARRAMRVDPMVALRSE